MRTQPPPTSSVVPPPGEGEAPTWVDVALPIRDDDAVTPIEVPELLDTALKEEFLPEYPDESALGAQSWGGTDTLAVYLDWHRYDEDWGIYYFDQPFRRFASRLAHGARAPVAIVASAALRQVLFHQFTHFEFEVVATELEGVLDHPLYQDYLSQRVRTQTRWTPAGSALEEALATWREVLFTRRRWPTAMSKPPDYQAEAERLASLAPDGYRHWTAVDDDATRREMTAQLVGLIANRPVKGYRWGRLERDERRQVPRYWVGTPSAIPLVGAIQAGPHRSVPTALARRALARSGPRGSVR